MGVMHVRRLTTQEWADENPVVTVNQMALDITTGDYRIGDGRTRWSKLKNYPRKSPPSGGGGGGVSFEGTDFVVPFDHGYGVDFPTKIRTDGIDYDEATANGLWSNLNQWLSDHIGEFTQEELQNGTAYVAAWVAVTPDVYFNAKDMLVQVQANNRLLLERLNNLDQMVANSIQVVEHGDDPNVERPWGPKVVYWLGSVEPVNAIDDDLLSQEVNAP